MKEEDTESPDFNTEDGKYDGVSYMYKNTEAFVVWNPNQIKSATDNVGTFSTGSDDIQMAASNNNEDSTLTQLEQQLNLSQYDNSRTNAAASQRGNKAADSGLLETAQSLLKRRDGTDNQTGRQRTLSEKELTARNQQDAESVERFAKEQNCWVNNIEEYLTNKHDKRIGKGSESFVYRKDEDTIIKMRTIDPTVGEGYSTIEEALQSIAIHNKLFPETAMKVVGFGRDAGELNINLSNPTSLLRDMPPKKK